MLFLSADCDLIFASNFAHVFWTNRRYLGFKIVTALKGF